MATLLWTIDDAGEGDTISVPRTCEFLAARDIRATWFVVPKSGGNSMSEEWKTTLLTARDGGHDLQLHGLTHVDCYEFGPPNWPATAILPSLQTQFDKDREDLLPRYTVNALLARIAEDMEIFHRELGLVLTCFRAPYGAISKALFAARARAGLPYHSCCYISATGYEHLRHRSGVIEAPIPNEYTWRGASEREAEFVELARRDLDRAVAASPVVVLLMHTHGIADDFDYTFRLMDSIHAYAEAGGHTFATVAELAASGALDEVATIDGPDILTL